MQISQQNRNLQETHRISEEGNDGIACKFQKEQSLGNMKNM